MIFKKFWAQIAIWIFHRSRRQGTSNMLVAATRCASPRYSTRICQPQCSSADFPRLPFDGYLNNPDFHAIDTTFPGLQLVSEEPYIFVVPNFLNKDEAAALVEKMEQSTSREIASSEKLLKLGDRTSSSVIPRNDEVPGIRQRIASLANVSPQQMQPLKITRYDEGGVFKKHTDCTVALDASGSYSPQQQPDRFPNRFCTVLIYLNNCERGGRTGFRWRGQDPTFYAALRAMRAPLWAMPATGLRKLAADTFSMAARVPQQQKEQAQSSSAAAERQELLITPRTGMAVVHFPCSSASAGLLPDWNAEHESEATVDTKFVCQSFIWSAPMDGQEVDQKLRAKFEAFERLQPETALSEPVL